MSVKDLDKKIIVTDAMTGEVIFTFDKDILALETKGDIIRDIYYDYVESVEHGISIKVGYRP